MLPISAGKISIETGIEDAKGCISFRKDLKNSATKSFSSEDISLIWPMSSARLLIVSANSCSDIWAAGFSPVLGEYVCCSVIWLKVDRYGLCCSLKKALVCFKSYAHGNLIGSLCVVVCKQEDV